MKEKTDFTLIISQIIEYLGVTRNDFAKTLGYKRSQSIYDISSGKSRPSFDFFERFFKSDYRNIFNPNWIFTGQGEMLKQAYLTEEDVLHSVKETEQSYCKGVPMVDETNSNFYLQNIQKTSLIDILPIFEIPLIKEGKAIMFEVLDDSFAPKINQGDYVICKEVDLSSHISSEEAKYVLALKDRLIFGNLEKREDNDFIVSKDELKQNSIEIKKNEIIKTFVVKMFVSKI